MRVQRAEGELARLAERVGRSSSTAGWRWSSMEPGAWVSVGADGARVELWVRSHFESSTALWREETAAYVVGQLLADQRIERLVTDAHSLQLEAKIRNHSVLLHGPLDPLDENRISLASDVVCHLATRLPVVREELFGPLPPMTPRLAGWRELKNAWGLEADESRSRLTGQRDGMPLEFNFEWGGTEDVTTLVIGIRAEHVELVASDALDGVYPNLPYRGGYKRLWVRVRQDNVSLRLHESGALKHLAKLIRKPMRLVWDEQGLTLKVRGQLDHTLHATAEQLLNTARVLGGGRTGASPYR